MLRQTKLEGTITVNIDGFKAKAKLRTRAVKTGGDQMASKTSKTNKIIRCSAIADNMPNTFIRMAEDARKEGKKAKRNAKKYAKRR